jgi:hypothetical protein
MEKYQYITTAVDFNLNYAGGNSMKITCYYIISF